MGQVQNLKTIIAQSNFWINLSFYCSHKKLFYRDFFMVFEASSAK
ncbi:hypothetical protein LEP1GSC172_3417 [Leptospira noguchii]|uniref:Uncharacterized protein n=1 Tax=Leptospira noguchii TaxID=28182 RepID=M6VFT8_9LEPT|nr:hypothetical protein LEP1GSC172_3417 [Leptospira noguchii]